MAGEIFIKNARQNNLKGITVSIPHRALTVVTGPSGAGKSSLAFDTLYAEGQRRYVESLSTYAKQFLDRMAKPDVDRIDGISPAVAIQQKNPTTSSRSTVGTATEIHDYLRLLWARVGRQHCHHCSAPVRSDSPTGVTDRIIEEHEGVQALIAAPIPVSRDVTHELIVENLRASGYVRVLIDNVPVRLDELPDGVRLDSGHASLIIDRLRLNAADRARIADSVATAFAEGDGSAIVLAGDRELRFSEHPVCSECGARAPEVTPALFSFNNPRGACPGCNGFGAVLEYDESLIVPDPGRTLAQGAIDPWTKPRYTGRRRLLRDTAAANGISMDTPWRKLRAADRRFLLDGKSGRFRGVIPFLRSLERKRYKQYIRVFLRQYQLAQECPACGGSRLRAEALSVLIDGENIGTLSSMTVERIAAWFERLELTEFERKIAANILGEIGSRLRFMLDVGLGYLALDRQTRTLSGGEAQRIALANALGSRLVDTLYVLDEPSIGLHPRDVGRLLDLLKRLRQNGNTVVVVEHDQATMEAADNILELGPGSGENGGDVVFTGPLADLKRADTLTGAYLNGTKSIPVPSSRRNPKRRLSIKGASLHNIESLDVDIPLDCMVAVTGVSGSGKSTLVHDILYRQLAARLKGKHGAKEHLGEVVGRVESIDGWKYLSDVVLIDQSPIGRTPRSNPITYLRAFDEIRNLFAQQPAARAKGFTATTFSFNAVNGGRCPNCEGAGHEQIEMVFMADVFIPCEHCGGTRFRPEVLEVTINGLSISDVLEFTVTEAINRFRHQERLGRALWYLQQVGLGYLRLGQPATTLSGGEAQRLKIARQLAGVSRSRGRKLYILDEPSTGLHLDDVRVLLKVLDRLVEAGGTVLFIEHHLDMIKRADWVIDMGPEGGDAGGRIVFEGTPEELCAAGTHTGRYLADVIEPPSRDAEPAVKTLTGTA